MDGDNVGSIRDGVMAMTATAVIGFWSRFRSPGTRTRSHLPATTYDNCAVNVAVPALLESRASPEQMFCSHYEPFPFADGSVHSNNFHS